MQREFTIDLLNPMDDLDIFALQEDVRYDRK